MRITTDHPASSYGRPVILDDADNPLDPAPGLRAARRRLGLSTAEVAAATGRSRRTIEGYEGGFRPVPAEVLIVMAKLLDAHGAGGR